MSKRIARTEKIDLRVSHEAKRTLEAAASAVNSSVSAFVLKSALARADEALADRRSFVLSKSKWNEFLAALDAPTRALPRIQRLLTKPGFFEGSKSDSASAPATATTAKR
ncbi:MAG: DUF1778 domain-containing protein [Nitrospira sp.]